MKTTCIARLVIILFLGVTPALTFAVEKSKVEKNQKGAAPIQEAGHLDKFVKNFNKQPENVRKEYVQSWYSMQQQIQANNSLGTLAACDKLEALIPENPSVFNVRGTVYLKLKDIAKSKENFMRACELSPKNDTFLFNLMETFFVNHEYEKAIKLIESLIAKTEKNENANIMTKSLLQFKAFIAYTKLGNKEKANEYAGLYTIDDDTPFYYCVRGINKWEEGKKQDAQADFNSALNIYAPSAMYQPFGDSLVETGYIESIEGPTIPHPKKE